MRPATAAAALVSAAPLVAGHGSLVYPPTRNAVDRDLAPWKGGKFPDTGDKEPFGCVCSNGTGICDVGQSCFWFSNGCTPGCATCSGDGARINNKAWCDTPLNATVNDPKYRTSNQGAPALSEQDVYKYNPWRSPGRAPTFDPCGMAGGTTVDQGLGGVYNTTQFAKLGDLGSRVLPARPTGTVWDAGGLAEAAFYIRANHGGGHQYRLCPKAEPLTEECFQRHPLRFEGLQALKWHDGKKVWFEGTYVEEGTFPAGSQWAKMPLPQTPNSYFPAPCEGNQPVDAPTSPNSRRGTNPGPCAGNWPTTVMVIDTLRIPADLAPGEYVLGWRWDCEMTAQVWQSCSDITIAPAQ